MATKKSNKRGLQGLGFCMAIAAICHSTLSLLSGFPIKEASQILTQGESTSRNDMAHSTDTPLDKAPLLALGSSKNWLQSLRFNNSNDPLIDQGFVVNNILNLPGLLLDPSGETMRAILNQSLAINNSSFLDVSFPMNIAGNEETLRLWNIRLIYLALHVHQHLPALSEARLRRDNPVAFQEMRDEYNVGNFDYECQGARYLITNILNAGVGAGIHWSMVNAFKAGLAVNRIVHFVHKELPANNPKNREYEGGWNQASCSRKDYQCMFAPPSPCIPTMENIRSGYQLNSSELQNLFEKGRLPDTIVNTTKVVFAVTNGNEMEWIPTKVMGRKPEAAVKRIISQLLDPLVQKSNDADPQIPLLRKAAAEGWRFGRHLGSLRTMFAAFAAYSLRPIPTNARLIEDFVQDALDSQGFDYLQPRTVGLAIRATDKCREESECLTFKEHMEVLHAEWTKLTNTSFAATSRNRSPLPVQIIFTTESKAVLEEQLDFHKRNATTAKFILNIHDKLPNTGYYEGKNKDEMLLCALTTIKLQLYPHLVVGNCCSNFARIIKLLSEGGLGASRGATFRCLQKAEDPRYRPCCWKDSVCLEKKANNTRRYLAELRNGSVTT